MNSTGCLTTTLPCHSYSGWRLEESRFHDPDTPDTKIVIAIDLAYGYTKSVGNEQFRRLVRKYLNVESFYESFSNLLLYFFCILASGLEGVRRRKFDPVS